MSMASYEPDRDYGDETKFEESQAKWGMGSGLCEHCHVNAALPDDDWCADCTGEAELAFEAVTDPKHPRHLEALVDIWDNREGK